MFVQMLLSMAWQGHKGELQSSPGKKKFARTYDGVKIVCDFIFASFNLITFNFSVTVLLIIMPNISKGEVSIFVVQILPGSEF